MLSPGIAPCHIVHWNAVDPVGNSMIISLGGTDAVYRIDRDTGDVEWRLAESFWCGGARRLASGKWLIGWGGRGVVGGSAAGGGRTFKLDLGNLINYSAFPVPPGQLSWKQRRNGMSFMNPRP